MWANEVNVLTEKDIGWNKHTQIKTLMGSAPKHGAALLYNTYIGSCL